MRNEEEQQAEIMNDSALGNVSVLSPSQRREQERQRREKAAKEAAEKEKRRIAAAKRKAAAEAAAASARRKEILTKLPVTILMSIFCGVISCIPAGMILFLVGAITDSGMGIFWWCIPVGIIVTIITFVKSMS